MAHNLILEYLLFTIEVDLNVNSEIQIIDFVAHISPKWRFIRIECDSIWIYTFLRTHDVFGIACIHICITVLSWGVLWVLYSPLVGWEYECCIWLVCSVYHYMERFGEEFIGPPSYERFEELCDPVVEDLQKQNKQTNKQTCLSMSASLNFGRSLRPYLLIIETQLKRQFPCAITIPF